MLYHQYKYPNRPVTFQKTLKMAYQSLIAPKPSTGIIQAWNVLNNISEKIFGLPLFALFPDTGVSGKERLVE
jgi:hypothetical protein